MGTSAEGPDPSHPPHLDERAERRVAWWLVVGVLASLTVAKELAGIRLIGPLALGTATILQLYLPLWRAQKLELEPNFVGLHRQDWRRDLRSTLLLMAITFPIYIVLHHFYVTQAQSWVLAAEFNEIARWIPERRFSPKVPEVNGFLELTWRAGAFLEMSATHIFAVALPEETFYRGYLQPRLASKWPPKRRVFGVYIGRAALVSTALFALGHILGEWNPLRLGPFLPGLLFAWQRNVSRSVLGAVAFHAMCNILGEVLFSLYIPM